MDLCEWRDIDGTKGYYSINREGLVLNNRTGKILKPVIDYKNYSVVELHVDGIRTAKKLHRLLASAFIPNPNNLPVIDHLDRNRQNNSLDNLRWATIEENGKNRTLKGTIDYLKVERKNGTISERWRARYRKNYKHHSLGTYKTEKEARDRLNYFLEHEHKYINHL